MSILKTAVFLASRFDEFSEVRDRLKRLIADYPAVQLTPIDLNDGNVSHRPPLVECLSYVRRSEFMILLLGDSYGSLAPKFDKSFTHLEYEEAIKEGSGTRVLVFCIGDHYANNTMRYSTDKNLAAWQRQVEENHTIGFFDLSISVDSLAKSIFDKLLTALYEMSFGKLAADTDSGPIEDLFDALEEDTVLADSEVSALDERNNNGLPLIEDGEKFKDISIAITQPNAVAAAEQREEAQRALDIQEYGIAVKHLRRALELKPLEMTSNFWLAKLYVALGRKEKAQDAMDLAERAARVAEREGLPYRAAASYMIAARAANLAGHAMTALRHAQKATEIAPRFARGYVELARQFALQNNSIDALKAIRQAYSLYPNSLREVFSDPAFRSMRKNIDSLMQEIRAVLARDVRDILNSESEVSKISGRDYKGVDIDGKAISQLIDVARQSVRRQFKIICSLVANAVSCTEDLEDKALHEDANVDSQEMLRFTRQGHAQIVEWHREPGDHIQPGETVFSFLYHGSSTVKPWSFRGRFPVRMVSRVGPNGSWVSSESPFLFSHVPASLPIRKVSSGSRLRGELKDISNLLDTVSSDLNVLVDRKSNLPGGGEIRFSNFMCFPGVKEIFFASSLIFLGLCFIKFSWVEVSWLWILLVGFVLLNFVRSGWLELTEFRQNYENLKRSIVEKKDQCKALHDQFESISGKLKCIESDSALSQKIASQALNCFERVCLRKSTRLLSFSSVYGAMNGDIVKGTGKQLENIISTSNREVTVRDDRPGWLSSSEDQKNSCRLYKVVDISQDKLILSPFYAYYTPEDSIL